MPTMTPDVNRSLTNGAFCRAASSGLSEREHSGHLFGLHFRPGPHLHVRSPWRGTINTYHACLPLRDSLVVNDCVQRIILPLEHFVGEMSGMTLIGPRVPGIAISPLQGQQGLSAGIACPSDALDTECSTLGLETQRAEMMKGSLAMRQRIGPRPMPMRRYGVARAVNELALGDNPHWSRQVRACTRSANMIHLPVVQLLSTR